VKNVLRNKSRTFMVIFIISLCICVYLSMTIVNRSIGERTVALSEDIDTTITIRPAGEFGGMTGGMPGDPMATSSEPIDEEIITRVETTAHVASVQVLAMSMETSSSSSSQPGPGRMGTQVLGEYPGVELVLFGGGSLSLLTGRELNAGDASENVALVGSGYKNESGSGVGDIITLNGTSFSVVGVFTSGSMFGDRTVIVPYNVFKTTYDIDGPSMLYVTVDSVGNMDTVEASLKNALGDDYDVVPLTEMSGVGLQESIDSIVANSALGAQVALITAGAVMIFVMILVTRERIKEIGVLKALGFRNSKIVSQFMTESISLAAIAFIVGILLTVVAGPFVASALLQTSSYTSGISGGGPPGGGRPDVNINVISQTDFSISTELAIFTFILVLILGLLGSLYPTIRAMRLQPAEALRYDE
jgi:putative ABC transport system permease protein